MAPRAMWTGQLRLSLVSFGVRLYAATESSGRVSMRQLHKDCHQRLKNQLVCPIHGPVKRDEVVKGYEYEKDSYVIIDQEDLDAIRIASTRTIDLVQFIDADEIDPLYTSSPYYLGPDGPVAEQAFRVIREAMERANKVAIGTLVLHNREQIVAIQPSGKGLLLSTLRYASEVRSREQVFSDIKDGDLDEEQIQLAQSIMQTRSAKFDPAAFHDRYQDAFFEVVKAKKEGQEPVIVEEEEAPRTFNFIEALKQSVEQVEAGAEGKAREKPAKKPAGKKAPKKPAAASVPATKKKRQRKRA
jgi:DNA end-binding protein Ku